MSDRWNFPAHAHGEVVTRTLFGVSFRFSRSLREVAIGRGVRFVFCSSLQIPLGSTQFLSTLDSVRILGLYDPGELDSVGVPSITEIRTSIISHFQPVCFTAEQVRDHYKFPRLKKLQIKLREGADKHLPQLMVHLQELSMLDVI